MLSFNKRIDPDSCLLLMDRFAVCDRAVERPVPIEAVRVDGNRLYVQSSRFPSGPFELAVPAIKDTPALWLYKDFKANEVAAGTRIAIPAHGR